MSMRISQHVGIRCKSEPEMACVLSIHVEKALDVAINAGDVSKRKLRRKQQLQTNPIDCFNLEFAPETLGPSIAINPCRHS